MPKQPNYVQLIPTKPQSFPISRLAESENDIESLTGRVPAEFGFDIDDNLELHFYDTQNNLINTTIVSLNSGIISIRSLLLPDGTREEKVVLDMTRIQTELGIFLSPGTYTLVINLFSDEIGTYGNRKLSIDISNKQFVAINNTISFLNNGIFFGDEYKNAGESCKSPALPIKFHRK